ncbi:DUF6397 family protein [Streptomyces sp. NPDC003374]
MSAGTLTHQDTFTAGPAAVSPGTALTESRAARELGLSKREFETAVQLGHVRTVPGEGQGGWAGERGGEGGGGGGGVRRVARAEIERLRGLEGFPEDLRSRVEMAGTKAGAQTLGVATARFTRLARLGLLVPAGFYLNRYRTVVWLYLAGELREFAADAKNTDLLKRPLPETARAQLDEGLDLRARNWRGRRLDALLRLAGDPWERAAAVASLLDPLQLPDIAADPWEHAQLHRLRPRPPAQAAPDSPAARVLERITTAQDADETARLRADLARAMREARTLRPAPRPLPVPAEPPSGHPGRSAHGHRSGRARRSGLRSRPHGAPAPARTRGLLGRFFGSGA